MFKNILDNARNLKIILCTFENLTRKNTLVRIEVCRVENVVDRQDEYAHILLCKFRKGNSGLPWDINAPTGIYRICYMEHKIAYREHNNLTEKTNAVKPPPPPAVFSLL
jgi:hypothetical protein